MSPYCQAIRSVIRLVAAGMIVVGGLLALLEWLEHRAGGAAVDHRKLMVGCLLLAAAVALLGTGSRLAAILAGESGEETEESDPPAGGAE